MSTTGPWRVVRNSEQLGATEKSGLCRRRRACESVESQFSAPSIAKTPPLAPATPTKRQM